jgi:hypothetical protein
MPALIALTRTDTLVGMIPVLQCSSVPVTPPNSERHPPLTKQCGDVPTGPFQTMMYPCYRSYRHYPGNQRNVDQMGL